MAAIDLPVHFGSAPWALRGQESGYGHPLGQCVFEHGKRLVLRVRSHGAAEPSTYRHGSQAEFFLMGASYQFQRADQRGRSLELLRRQQAERVSHKHFDALALP